MTDMETNTSVWEYAAAKLSKEDKQKVKVLAAAKGMSAAEFGGQMLADGLKEYLSGKRLDLSAVQARELAEALGRISA